MVRRLWSSIASFGSSTQREHPRDVGIDRIDRLVCVDGIDGDDVEAVVDHLPTPVDAAFGWEQDDPVDGTGPEEIDHLVLTFDLVDSERLRPACYVLCVERPGSGAPGAQLRAP